MLLLPHLLALDAVLQVESPQTSHSDTLVSKLAVKEFGSVFESESRPLLKGLVARQEVYMMLFQFHDLSLMRMFLWL